MQIRKNANGIIYNKDSYDAAIKKVMQLERIPIVYLESISHANSIDGAVHTKDEDIIGFVTEIKDTYIVAKFLDEKINEAIDALSNGKLVGMNYIADYTAGDKNNVSVTNILNFSLVDLQKKYATACIKEVPCDVEINKYTAKYYGLKNIKKNK